MSETDVQINNLDYSKLNQDLNNINDNIETMLYFLYYILGATTILSGFLFYKFVNNLCFSKNVVKLENDSVLLLSNLENKIDLIDNKIVTAIKVNDNEFSKIDSKVENEESKKNKINEV